MLPLERVHVAVYMSQLTMHHAGRVIVLGAGLIVAGFITAVRLLINLHQLAKGGSGLFGILDGARKGHGAAHRGRLFGSGFLLPVLVHDDQTLFR